MEGKAVKVIVGGHVIGGLPTRAKVACPKNPASPF